MPSNPLAVKRNMKWFFIYATSNCYSIIYIHMIKLLDFLTQIKAAPSCRSKAGIIYEWGILIYHSCSGYGTISVCRIGLMEII